MATQNTSMSDVPATEPLSLAELVQYGQGAVVSRSLLKTDAGSSRSLTARASL